MADWEEVKRLAADFQKVQLSTTTQKLSDRNCVEIISWLIDRKMIDLIFTCDGKEYLTPSQLVDDIIGELYDNGGRINLVELAKNLNVDLSHINTVLNDVVRKQKNVQLVLGQLIDSTYIARIAVEINEKLSHQGQVNVSELTLMYDLPAEFLQQLLEKNLGKLIFGKQDDKDPRLFFTESFIARSKAKIRGALTGLTRPTSVASILNYISMNEKLFFSLFDQCSSYGTLTSRLSGAQYIPNIYARSQNEWVSNFYKQNGYLEFDALSRLGITDYRLYLKKQFPNEEIHYLNSCAISKAILERAQADVDECIVSKSYIDLQSNLPSVFNLKDIDAILSKVLTTQKVSQTIVINNYIMSKAFVEALAKDCENMVKENAKAVVDSGRYQQYQISLKAPDIKAKFDDTEEKVDKRDERRKKAAGGKTGGGLTGRETKTKSTKKFSRSSKDKHLDDDDDATIEEKKVVLEVVSAKDVEGIINPLLENEGLDELLDPLVDHLQPQLNQQGLVIAADVFKTTVADQTASRRQTHNELQNKLNILIDEVRLFEKGVKLVPNDLQPSLVKYLLKTMCTDIVSELLNYVAAENNLSVLTNNSNYDQRIKFVNELSTEYKTALLPLVKCLAGQSIDDFMAMVENALAACSMILKKIDKKKDRVVVLNHKHELIEQLNKCEDLALVLHLAVLIIFISATSSMIHASGKHVAQILEFLKQYLSADEIAELSSYHDFVTLMLSGGSEAENAKEKLKEKMLSVKHIANEFKKRSAEQKVAGHQ